MRYVKSILLGFCFLTVAPQMQAAHIIGGVITYECTAPGNYTITMKIYRDCQGGGANFDSSPNSMTTGKVTVYRGNTIVTGYGSVVLRAPQVSRILPEDNPCLVIPPGVCVEEGVYRFNLDLPVSNQTYTIAYQRCCRNNSITNIVNPESTGATYFVQINPESQAVCNSSPVFDDFPPIVICNNDELVYDHSATDTDPNTQLVYSICSPFIGGGTGGTGPLGTEAQRELPNGVSPNPDLPPPYDPVVYVQPFYSFEQPLGVDANLRIDPNTGILRGRPTAEGQYVVGICVQEFRNGVFMSEIRRDFQFNVGRCEQRVLAEIEADEIIRNGIRFVRSCGNATVALKNESTDQNFIEEYAWEFLINGTLETFNTRDVTVTFPDEGIYNGQLILNRNNMFSQCRDSIDIQVGVFGAISSDFEFQYDTCVSGPTTFTELAETENDQITEYRWLFGDGDTSTFSDPIHEYLIPGEFDVILEVEDEKGCIASNMYPLTYFPVPALVVAAPDRFLACTPATINFDNLSRPINEEYTINWMFGDGNTAEGLSVSNIYEDPGLYSIDLEIISPLGCQTDVTFRNWITIKESPEAAFVYMPEELNFLQREVFFTNQSQRGNGYQWKFGDGGVAFVEHPVYEYPDTGIYDVELITFSDNGCTDTARATLDVAPINTYFLPNAFSPNDDGLNDEYIGKGITKGMRGFTLTIWNRWGELIYSSTDPDIAWNGKRNNDGQPAPKGVYHCQVEYFTARGEKRTLETPVTLLR